MELNLTHREKEIQKVLEIYREQILQTFISCNIYAELNSQRDKYLEEMNLAPAFFGTIFKALRASAILGLTKLFDDREKNSLNKLLNIAQNNLPIFTKENKARRIGVTTMAFFIANSPTIDLSKIEADREALKRFEPTLTKFKVLRDKYHAHFDIPDPDLIARNQFELGELEQMRDFAGSLWNFYNVGFEGGSYQFTPMNNFDFVDVLEILKGHNAKRESELRNMEENFENDKRNGHQ